MMQSVPASQTETIRVRAIAAGQTGSRAVSRPRRRRLRLKWTVSNVIDTIAGTTFILGVVCALAFLVKSEMTELTAPKPTLAAPSFKLTVASGDTLWAIASRYAPADVNPQTFEDRICALNPTISEDSALRPGSVILVPGQSASASAAALSSAPGSPATIHRQHHHRRSVSASG